jgi:hypothetical protein
MRVSPSSAMNAIRVKDGFETNNLKGVNDSNKGIDFHGLKWVRPEILFFFPLLEEPINIQWLL